jgi:two-component system sensor histidine kinase PilS (NtrC family)
MANSAAASEPAARAGGPIRDLHKVINARASGYILLVCLLALFGQLVIFEGAPRPLEDLLMMLAVVTLGQALVSLKPSSSALFALFMADLAVTMTVVRSTGSSSSPFLVLFPVLTLSSSLVFPTSLLAGYIAASVLFMSFSVGFGLAIAGNGLAIVATGLAGSYLVRALDTSGRALRVSEGARRRLENLQKAILANIPSGLMSVDSEGRVIQVNAVGQKILGLSEPAILGRRLKDLLPEIDAQVTRLNTLVPVQGQLDLSSPDRPTVRFRKADGEDMQLGYSVARLSDPDDRSVLGSLVVFQDLTQILRMEENLRLSEKLAAVGKLAAGIAHEIRNPLAGISGSAQMLAGLTGLAEDDQKLLKIIQKESARLDGLITEFLDYVRPPKLRLEAILIQGVCESVLEGLKVNAKWSALGCAVDLVNRLGPDARAQGDANKITQVLMNLLLNSAQAGAKRVQIVIERSDSGHVALRVRDDGGGISAENLKRLFEPFFTTKDTGTGLGLAVSYRLIEAMEGRMTVVSPLPDFAAKGGTEFTIELKSSNI